MNCTDFSDRLAGLVSRTLSSTHTADCKRHLAGCPDCSEALRGAEGLALLKARVTEDVPPNLFDSVMQRLDRAHQSRGAGRFWLGTGFGGALAASLIAVALALGWIGPPDSQLPEIAEFRVALGETRNMDLAIETDRELQGATISIMLTGGVELAGYGERRELTWISDLQAGTNKLSLPVVVVNEDGGRMVVRLSHPQSEKLFVVRLKTTA